jgi:hypothetical protein
LLMADEQLMLLPLVPRTRDRAGFPSLSGQLARGIAGGTVRTPSRPFAEYRNSPLWSAVEASLTELVATHEVTVNTAPDYVIGYLCRELVAKKVVVDARSER